MNLRLNGSTLGLTDATFDPGVTYAETLTAIGDSTLAAGRYEIGQQAGQIVTVSDLLLESGLLTLGSSDGYTLAIAALTSTGGSIAIGCDTADEQTLLAQRGGCLPG